MLVHLFVNPHADGTDSTKSQPSHWNAEHSFSGSNTGSLLYRDVLASNGANWLTPSPSPGYALLSSGAGAPPTWGPVTTPTFPLAATAGGTGIANNVANTITFSGNFGITLTLTGTTAVTFPTSGILHSTTNQVLAITGTAAAPSYSAVANPNGGMFFIGSQPVFSAGGTAYMEVGADFVQLKSTTGLTWSSGVINSANDVGLSRTAASTLALGNGTVGNSSGTLQLATLTVSNPITVGNGGTGVNTLTNHGVLLGQAAGNVVATSAGTAGQLLTSNGAAADPTFQGPVSQTTALTGTQDNFALSTNCRNLYCTNATLLSFTGFAAGYDGQKVRIYSNGAGQVDIVPQLAGTTSAAANRVINAVTVGNTSAAPGVGWFEIEYSTTFSRWVLIGHEQGALIAWTPVIQFGGANVGITYTTQNGTYYVKGKTLFLYGRITLSSKGSSAGVATITGLPIVNNSAGSYGQFNANFYGQLSGITTLFGFIAPGSNTASLQISGAAATGTPGDTFFTNTSDMVFNGSYPV